VQRPSCFEATLQILKAKPLNYLGSDLDNSRYDERGQIACIATGDKLWTCQ
jgi:hypothetical protein